MNPLLIAPLFDIAKQMISKGGSGRKEAIGAAFAIALGTIVTTIQEACVDSCTIGEAVLSVSGGQWATLVTSGIGLVLHLNAKAKDAAGE